MPSADPPPTPGARDPAGAGVLTMTLTIRNRRGLHARAAAKFVTVAGAHDAVVTVRRGDTAVDGRSIMGLMMLAAAQGSTIDLTAQGPQAAAVLAALRDLVETRRFDEGE